MKNSIVETFVGFFIVSIAIFFIFFLYKNNASEIFKNNYNVYYAQFNSAAGLIEGGEIKISGVNIGSINKISLSENNKASLKLLINKKVEIPSDSSISVENISLIGGKCLSIKLGEEKEFLKENEEFIYTSDGISLDSIIFKAIDKFLG